MSIWDDFKNEFRKPGNIVIQLLLVNLAIFVVVNLVMFLYADSKYIFHKIFFLPATFKQAIYQPWALITYQFTQVSFWHLLYNLIGLYFFGQIVSDFLGRQRILPVYILGGMAGGLMYMLIYSFVPSFANYDGPGLIGSSGAVFSLAVVAAMLAPNMEVRYFFLPIKLKYMVAMFIFLSFLGTRGANAGGQFAHLAGALMGYLYLTSVRKGNDLGKPIEAIFNWFKDLGKPRPAKMKVSHRKEKSSSKSSKSSSKSKSSSDVSQEEIDVILDKISQSGYESLTKEEKAKLFSASQKKK